MEKRCAWCGENWNPKRSHALTCSSRCRMGRWRAPRSLRLARQHGLRDSDFWKTNPADFAPVNAEFHFGLDAATTEIDALCLGFITPEINALEVPWLPYVVDTGHPPAAWCNPPYGSRRGGLRRWIDQGWQESTTGLTGVFLVPPSMGSRYKGRAMKSAAEVRFYRSRLAFLSPDTGEPAPQNRGDSCLIVFRPGYSGPADTSYID